MTGEIRRFCTISKSNVTQFHADVMKALNDEKFHGLYVEIQYSTAMQPDGRCLFSAILIGRVPAPDVVIQ